MSEIAVGARLAPPSDAKDGPRMDAGAAPGGPGNPDPFAVAGLADVGYAIDNWHAEFVEQKLGAPVGAWRSVPNSYNGFFIESFIDEIAHASRSDPCALRRALLGSSARAVSVLDKAASLSRWGRVPTGRSQGMSFWNEAGSMICQVVEISITRKHRLRVHKVTAAVDCGYALNPTGVEAQIQGAILDGLSAALYAEITISNGRVAQSNFHNYRLLRISAAPVVDVHSVESGAPLGGIGEVAVPGLAPALTNAIFAATGDRIRRLPVVAAGGRWQI